MIYQFSMLENPKRLPQPLRVSFCCRVGSSRVQIIATATGSGSDDTPRLCNILGQKICYKYIENRIKIDLEKIIMHITNYSTAN